MAPLAKVSFRDLPQRAARPMIPRFTSDQNPSIVFTAEDNCFDDVSSLAVTAVTPVSADGSERMGAQAIPNYVR